MKLRCVGGPFHNQYKDIPDNYRLGDCFRIYNYPKGVSFNFSFPPTSDQIAVKQELYIVDEFVWNDRKQGVREFKFLRYRDIDMLEVLMLQFK